jgi:hypothetical protein
MFLFNLFIIKFIIVTSKIKLIQHSKMSYDDLQLGKHPFENSDWLEDTFTSRKNKTFVIKPLTQENLKENVLNITEIFTRYEPISQKYPYENLLELFGKIAGKSVRENLGISCYEVSTGKWAGCLLNEDFSTCTTDPSADYNGKYDFILDFMDYIEEEGLKKLGVIQSKNKYEQIHVIACGISKELWGNNILKKMVEYMISFHPVTKNSKIFL